ncbi:MAG: aminotransferase class I/II-fold pyridoxal phosphate-dependent enzyme [bacterium]|nr:aminotransferase class I/II-fold pyridoxal phosphate-dependent enzyme [bacterium]
MNTRPKLSFASDYLEGAHPRILQRLAETNMLKTAGYGLDEFSEAARQKIRAACQTPEADVFFFMGGTQTNAVMIGALLKPYQGVIAADSGHISLHEAGAIEAGGHKVLELPHRFGKINAETLSAYIQSYWQDENREHMVMPGLVYISQPTEYGTLYSLEELTKISEVCAAHHIALYLDGARLAYALASPANNVSLIDIARLCTTFYIGGTKCGTLFGEAAVIPQHNYIPHLFTIIKQRGALLAKGRIAGLQFDTLFSDNLYFEIGRSAIEATEIISARLQACGYKLAYPSPTNQLFIELEDARLKELSAQVEMSFWEKPDTSHTVVRLATSWATSADDVAALLKIMQAQH